MHEQGKKYKSNEIKIYLNAMKKLILIKHEQGSGMWRREKSGGVQEKFFQNLSMYSENFST